MQLIPEWCCGHSPRARHPGGWNHWALGSITTNKASGSDGIPAELFKILKDDAVKGLHSIYQQIGKSALATGQEKVSFHSNPKERQCQRMFKLPTITLISHASRVMLKILQARLQQYMHSICQQIWKTQQWPQDWKRSVFTPIPKKSNAK